MAKAQPSGLEATATSLPYYSHWLNRVAADDMIDAEKAARDLLGGCAMENIIELLV